MDASQSQNVKDVSVALDERIRALSLVIKQTFGRLVAEVATERVTPLQLSKVLAIDDSLAARVLRGLRHADPLASARELPSPQGLRIFIAATRRQHARAETLADAEDAVEAFVLLLGEFPTGRAGLDAAIESWLPEVRRRGERAASQAAYRAISQVIGHSTEFVASATIIQPSSVRGDTCDSITVSIKRGVRRLRAGSPILALGWFNSPVDPATAVPDEASRQIVETLAGEREVTDPHKFLLPDLDGIPPPSLRLIETSNMMRLVLDRGYPPVNVPVSYASAKVTRNAYLRYQRGTRTTDGLVYLNRVPTRVLHLNLLLHVDVFPHYVPAMVPRLHGMTVDPAGRHPDLVDLDRVEMNVEVSNLGRGLERMGATEFGGYRELFTRVFAAVGWNPEHFRVFRFRVQYPLPFVSYTTWLDLPPAPAADSYRV